MMRCSRLQAEPARRGVARHARRPCPPISAMRCCSSISAPISRMRPRPTSTQRPPAQFPMCRCCSGRSASWWRLGFWFIALFARAFWLSARRRLDRYRWFLWAAFFSLPLPWIAAELGWIVAEYGRQPWVIEGVLPTALGVSSTDAGQRAVQPVGLRTVLFGAAGGRSLSAGEIHPARPRSEIAPALEHTRRRTSAE